MPIHEFYNESNGRKIEIYVPVNAPSEDHQFQIVEGQTYKRVYSAPLASVDSTMKDATKEDFRRLTTNKKGLTVGQMWEMSAEMSEHRAHKNGGVDNVKESFYKNYEKEVGKLHPEVERKKKLEAANAHLKSMGIKIDF
jgi:hypothetical protein